MSGLDSTVDILSEDCSSQSVHRVVRLSDHVYKRYDDGLSNNERKGALALSLTILIRELDDNTNGTEDLLLHDLHMRLGVGEDGWLDEVPFCTMTFTAGLYCRTLLFTGFDVAHDTLNHIEWCEDEELERKGDS